MIKTNRLLNIFGVLLFALPTFTLAAALLLVSLMRTVLNENYDDTFPKWILPVARKFEFFASIIVKRA